VFNQRRFRELFDLFMDNVVQPAVAARQVALYLVAWETPPLSAAALLLLLAVAWHDMLGYSAALLLLAHAAFVLLYRAAGSTPGCRRASLTSSGARARRRAARCWTACADFRNARQHASGVWPSSGVRGQSCARCTRGATPGGRASSCAASSWPLQCSAQCPSASSSWCVPGSPHCTPFPCATLRCCCRLLLLQAFTLHQFTKVFRDSRSSSSSRRSGSSSGGARPLLAGPAPLLGRPACAGPADPVYAPPGLLCAGAPRGRGRRHGAGAQSIGGPYVSSSSSSLSTGPADPWQLGALRALAPPRRPAQWQARRKEERRQEAGPRRNAHTPRGP